MIKPKSNVWRYRVVLACVIMVILIVGIMTILIVGWLKPRYGPASKSSAVPRPINLTGTVTKIESDGFFLRSDFSVHPDFSQDKQTNNVFVYTSQSILGGPKTTPNLSIGMKVKIPSCRLVCLPMGNETLKPAGCIPEYRDNALCFATRSNIEET